MESPRAVEGEAGATAAKDRVDATDATDPGRTRSADGMQADSEVEISDFDCFSEWEHKEGEGLRAQRGGGPHGAAWNWYGAALRCQVEVRSSCRGDGVVKLRIGKHYESAQAVALGAPGAAASRSVSFDVAPAHWERELEASDVFPFETLAVGARLDAHCLVPPGVEAEPIHLLDGFVGRFSGGE